MLQREVPSLDELRQELINVRMRADETIWYEAALIYALLHHHKVKASEIASDLNCTARHVHQLARTHQAFPTEEDRNPELTFTHHRVAARAPDPQAALVYAGDEQLSVRQLEEVVKGETNPTQGEKSEVEKLWDKIKKVLDAGGPDALWLTEQFQHYCNC